MLEPIQSRVNSSRLFRQKDFYKQALDAFKFDGTLTCQPQNISSLVVYYNKKLLKASKVAAPKPGWTWKQMVTAAQKLTKDKNGDGKIDEYGLGVEVIDHSRRSLRLVERRQHRRYNKNPTRLTLSTPAAQGALREFLKLHTVYGVTPGDAELEAEDDETRFQNGRLAMVLLAPLDAGIPHDQELRLGHRAPAEVQEAGRHPPLRRLPQGQASKVKNEAWKFVEYAVGPKGVPGDRAHGPHGSRR